MRRIAIDASASSTTLTAVGNVDFILTEYRIVKGGEVLAENAVFGDYIVAQVVHPNGVTVIAEYVHKKFLYPLSANIWNAELDAGNLDTKIPPGFIIRVIYYPVDSNPRNVVVNYTMETVL